MRHGRFLGSGSTLNIKESLQELPSVLIIFWTFHCAFICTMKPAVFSHIFPPSGSLNVIVVLINCCFRFWAVIHICQSWTFSKSLATYLYPSDSVTFVVAIKTVCSPLHPTGTLDRGDPNQVDLPWGYLTITCPRSSPELVWGAGLLFN